jgi:hypothetical protein
VKNIENVNVNEVLKEIMLTQEIMAKHKNVKLILHKFPEMDKQ